MIQYSLQLSKEVKIILTFILFIVHQRLRQASMAASLETPSAAEKTAQSSLLNIKSNQNLILDLNCAKCDGFLQPLVECLQYSPLVIKLTKSKIIHMVHLSKAYSNASYQKGEEQITLEIANLKTHISKS